MELIPAVVQLVMSGLIGSAFGYLFYWSVVKKSEAMFMSKQKKILLEKIIMPFITELYSKEELMERMSNDEFRKNVVSVVKTNVRKVIKEKVPPMFQGQVLIVTNNYFTTHRDKVYREIADELKEALLANLCITQQDVEKSDVFKKYMMELELFTITQCYLFVLAGMLTGIFVALVLFVAMI